MSDVQLYMTWNRIVECSELLSRAFSELADIIREVTAAFENIGVGTEIRKNIAQKFAPCLKLESNYDYIPIFKRNMPYQRRNY